MKITNSNIFLLIDFLLLNFCFFSDNYRVLVYILFFSTLARLLYKIGNGSFFLELIYVYSVFICLFMPLLGYIYFPITNPLAKLWVRYMPITEEQYFSFNIPAVIFLGFGFFLFRKNEDGATTINALVNSSKEYLLKIPPRVILTLVFSSIIAYSISNLLPGSLAQVNNFLYYSLFAGFFYIFFFKGFPNKKLVIGAIVLFLLIDAIRSSMFTIITYMMSLFVILLLAGKRISLSKKIALLFLGLSFFIFLQFFKLDLRRAKKQGNDINVFTIASNVITEGRSNNFDEFLFPLYVRSNQGYNIALVQKRIPSKKDYLQGIYLVKTFLSAFVPRLFWPDKPESGGKENMRMYTGYDIKGWSTNVSPIGEAYGNFGNVGGWIYLFLFALFIRLVYIFFIKFCKQKPLLFIWMPMMFFQTVYVMETDSLQAFNSLVKGAVFLFFMIKLFPVLFSPTSK